MSSKELVQHCINSQVNSTRELMQCCTSNPTFRQSAGKQNVLYHRSFRRRGDTGCGDPEETVEAIEELKNGGGEVFDGSAHDFL